MKLSILGCGSSLPKKDLFQSSQLLELRNKQFMIDCGEGTQIRLRQFQIKTNRLNHIFISHLHGDHCFGIVPLISTLGMMGRTSDIHIHAHPELEKIITSQIKFFCEGLPFEIHFHNFSPFKVETIYDDRSITVKTIPLKHRVPCCGFLFEEKESQPHINRKMIDAFNIPVTMIKDIKNGGNYTLPDGTVIDNKQLTLPPTPGKRYAYCSDTAYNEKIIPIIQGVDALYHEATFLHDDTIRIKETLHSSALQAATIAQKAEVKQLIIGHYSARHNNINHFLKEAKTIFPNTYAATDGTTYQF